MRNKIIAVNAVIVLIVGLLSYVLMRQAFTSAASNTGQLLGEAKHDVQGAAARLQLDALRAERWLTAKAGEATTLDVFTKSSETARREAATALSDQILSAARGNALFEGTVPAIVMLIDENGKMVGRNGSTLNAGRDIAADYPSFKDSIGKGHAGSDVWANKDKQDGFLASYAPVKGADGRVIGAIALGVTLTDELSRVGDATTGRALVLVVPQGDAWSIVAHSTSSSTALNEGINTDGKESIKRVVAGGRVDAVPSGDIMLGSASLEGLGDGKRAALAAAAPASLIENAAGLATPVLGVMGLGVLLVIAGGWMLGNYITQPINLLEEGLLAILNGQQDKRFELDHPELGGLAFRIDQLLNQLMGIEEDTTDDQGRPSKAPSAADFKDAMAVDDKREQQMDPAVVQQLAAEPANAYYARIYREYIAAKKANGDQTDHITEQAFTTRIQGMEKDAAQKYGRPVRYQVNARGKEVVLLAVPLTP
jgi:hypothetical protein